MKTDLPRLNLGDENPLSRFQGSQLLNRNSSIRRKLAASFSFTTPKSDAMNRFKGLKELLTLPKKSQDLESQTSIRKVNQYRAYKVFKHYQKIIYLLLDQPKSSMMGKCLLGAIFTAIFFNVGEAVVANPDTIVHPHLALVFFERLALCIFILELILRLISSTAFDDKISHAILKPSIVIDLIAIFPFFIQITPEKSDFQVVTSDLKLLSLFKVMSALKLLRYVKNVSIFAKGVYKSVVSLLFFVFVIVVISFIFAIMIYYAEYSHPSSQLKKGIPTALWWAVVTISTVGYGDVAPKTPGGKVIGGLASICGTLLLALPVVILGYHFQEVYNDREEEKLINKVKEKELKGSNNLNHDQKEVYFLKRRIESIEASNKKIMSRLDNSGSIYKGVSKDLKMLYTSIYAGIQTRKKGRTETFTEKIRGMEKFKAAKTKIKLIHIFKHAAPKTTDRSSECQLGREASALRINGLAPSSPNFDEMADFDGLRVDTIDTLKKMARLVSHTSPLLREKQERFEALKLHLAKPRMPRIVVDKPDETITTPEENTYNNDDFVALDIPVDPNVVDNTKLNLSLMQNSRLEADDGEAYQDLLAMQSFQNKSNPIGASKQLFLGEDPQFRRSSAYFPSANSVSLAGNLTRVLSRGSCFQPRSAFLEPKGLKDYYQTKQQFPSMEQTSIEEADSKGSSRIIEIPFKRV